MHRQGLVLISVLIALSGTACDSEPPVGLPADPPVSPPADLAIEPPTAEAGPVQTLVDRDRNGTEVVVLDASASRPGSRQISRYEWKEAGSPLIGVTFDGGRTLSVDLEVGRHSIILTVTDDAGHSDSDDVRVDVLEPDPNVAIVSPREGGMYAIGRKVDFRARVTDQNGDPLPGLTLAWFSDRDGAIGTGEGFSRSDLSIGPHVITLVSTGQGEFMESDTVRLSILEPPTVTILAPAEGTDCAVFDEMRLEGRCIDRNGNTVNGREVYWEPDMWMGRERRYEMSVDVVCTGPGPETIALVCTDASGLTSRAEVTVDYFISFSFNVQAVLSDFGCTDCHGPSVQEANVRLDTYTALVNGRTHSGPLIVPGSPTEGILITKLLSGHHSPLGRVLTTPFYWGWIYPETRLVPWWIEHFLAPWIENGAIDN